VYDVGELQDEEAHAFFQQLKLKVPAILLVNKIDSVKESVWKKTAAYFAESGAYKAVIPISALKGTGVPELLKTLLQFIPQGDPFYSTEDLSDLPTRFFVGEIIREKIFELYHQEVPYHSTVLVQEFTEKTTLIKIRADIIVQREMQKIILIGDKGSMIKKLGTAARIDIEQFLGQKVFLELFVKVRPKWRDQDVFLREYGYE
jgi:GTP-binding protein Era